MRRVLSVAAGVGVVVGVGCLGAQMSSPVPSASGESSAGADGPSLAKTARASEPVRMPAVPGLDLGKMYTDEKGTAAPASDGRVARLTIDSELQKTATALLKAHHFPEAAVVMMDAQTGQVLVYASHVEKGPARDLCAEATSPSASVFKIVTGAALVEHAKGSPETKQCYSGGGSERLTAADIADDPKRDKWCLTVTQAMGRSINPVFAKLALKHLLPAQVEGTAHALGWGSSVPFDVPVQPSLVTMPADRLEYARTAAGFWNTTLSPLQGAWLGSTLARGGEAVRPTIVSEVHGAKGEVLAKFPTAPVLRRAVTKETAQAVTMMMEHTITDGTSYRAFHDNRRRSFLPGIHVAGKTGTLTDHPAQRYYTWFTGFAPSRPSSVRQVSIAVLVVNGPSWKTKANVVARDMLRAYFAKHEAPNVSRPTPPGQPAPKKKKA